jgi:2-oxoacid:acceptor oxidoreductase gamma subunit (pyruvate/2-ketoisovalerate family)
MLEIKLMGRGGQGVVTASQMLGEAYFRAGHYPQCYPMFGGERRGAPVAAFLRVDNKRIHLKCEIRRPDVLIFFDQSMMVQDEIDSLIREKPLKVLVNCHDASFLAWMPRGVVLWTLDVQEMIGKGPPKGVINTAMLGAFCRLDPALPLERVLEAISAMVPNMVEENLEMARLGYRNAILHKVTS